jgi:putative pyruvate formate lyase activating enzyme
MAHFGEEAIISGSKGSGTFFFAGCNLDCVFCQNYDISQSCLGKSVTAEELAQLFIKMEKQKVHNINLVTPSHFAHPIAKAIKLAKESGVTIPFVYNTGGYDSLATLRMLDGLIDIYMPDLKYADDTHGLRYCGVPDYFSVTSKALIEMYRQVGSSVIRGGVMQKGLLIRHLVLPGLSEDSMGVLDWIKSNTPQAIVSLLAQYRPLYRAKEYPEINRRPTNVEYRSVADYLSKLGLQSC